MSEIQLAVISIEGTWRVLVNGERFGRFEGRGAALSCACAMARIARDEGLRVELLLQDYCGEVTALRVAEPADRHPLSNLPAGASA
jgi:hypothetical protein